MSPHHPRRFARATAVVFVSLLAGGCAPLHLLPDADLDTFVRETKGISSSWDELWLIEREPGPAGVTPRVRGGLRIVAAGNSARVLEPAHVGLRAQVTGRLAQVHVVERYDDPAKATTQTPSTQVSPTLAAGQSTQFEFELALPAAAAVAGFELQLGERRIRAVVRPRTSARRLYQAARARGLTSSLLSVDAGGRFVHRLGRLPAGQTIGVDVEYLHAVPQHRGWCALEMPAIVGRGVPTSLRIGIEAGAVLDQIDPDLVDPDAVITRPTKTSATVAHDAPTGLSTQGTLRWRVAPEATSVLFWGQVVRSGQLFGLWTRYGAFDQRALDRLELQSPHPSPSAAGSTPGTAFVARLRSAPGRSSREFRVVPAGAATAAIARAWATLELAAMAKRGERTPAGDALRTLAKRGEAFALEHGLVSHLTALQLIDATPPRR